MSQCIQTLVNGLDQDELPHLRLVILNGDLPNEEGIVPYRKDLDDIRKMYPKLIESKQIRIVDLSTAYPQWLKPMVQTFNDPVSRIKWRSKQVLDFAYLMELGMRDGDYYVQLEDDVNAAKHYLTEMAWWLERYFYRRNEWFALSFYIERQKNDREQYPAGDFYGFIGQLYRSNTLPNLIRYFRDHFSEKPVDWLMADYLHTGEKLQPEKFKMWIHSPPLFQHVGLVSSLEGKQQEIRAQAFMQLHEIDDDPPFGTANPALENKEHISREFLEKHRFVIGITSVSSRNKSYVSVCLDKLLEHLQEWQKPHVKIVLLNAEYPPSAHRDMSALKRRFEKAIDEDLLEIVELKQQHSQLRDKKEWKQGKDSLEQTKWRTKQALDYAHLLNYVSNKYNDYYAYIQLEDDVIAARNYFTEITWWTSEYFSNRRNWIGLSFYNSMPYLDRHPYPLDAFHGFIGQMFRMGDIGKLATYIGKNFEDQPVDWIVRSYLQTEVDEDRKLYVHSPSLFEHIGVYSSLPGKLQFIKAAKFADGDLHKPKIETPNATQNTGFQLIRGPDAVRGDQDEQIQIRQARNHMDLEARRLRDGEMRRQAMRLRQLRIQNGDPPILLVGILTSNPLHSGTFQSMFDDVVSAYDGLLELGMQLKVVVWDQAYHSMDEQERSQMDRIYMRYQEDYRAMIDRGMLFFNLNPSPNGGLNKGAMDLGAMLRMVESEMDYQCDFYLHFHDQLETDDRAWFHRSGQWLSQYLRFDRQEEWDLIMLHHNLQNDGQMYSDGAAYSSLDQVIKVNGFGCVFHWRQLDLGKLIEQRSANVAELDEVRPRRIIIHQPSI